MGVFSLAERVCSASIILLVDKSVFTKMSEEHVNLLPDRGSICSGNNSEFVAGLLFHSDKNIFQKFEFQLVAVDRELTVRK